MRISKQKPSLFLIVLAFTLVEVMILRAQPSSANSISFQGALTGANGQPLANGNYSLTFKFYDVPTGGTALATSNVPNVPVTGGIASTAIPVDAGWFDGQTRYLGIRVNGGTELTPRVLVTAVPYAINAATLTGVGGKIYLVSAGGEVWIGPTNQTSLAFGNNPDLGYSVIQSYRLASNAIGALHLNSAGGDVVVGSPDETAMVFFNNHAQGYSGLQSYRLNRTAAGALRLQPGGGTVHIGSDNPNEPSSGLQVLGTTRTSVLQITGGADLAEHLSVTDADPRDEFTVDPGMVVSIDSTGNRKFKLSNEPYDRKRVGIISGGNGVKPGLILGDEGNPAVAGDRPIALTGQVWCHADASFGEINPGDLLTTSSTPGHAMKVSDDAKARFAVLGQALTGLKEGRGWVQVLVRCQ